jgi:TRAP-type C4-dicarboxylate transport system permease small subunit
MEYFRKLMSSLSEKLNWVASVSLLLMIFLVCANIITRLFGRPITGTYELVEVLLVILVSFSFGFGSLTDCHIKVDLLLQRFPLGKQRRIDKITNLVSVGLFALVGWRCFVLATNLRETGEVSTTLWIPHFPLLYGVSFNCIVVCFVLLLMKKSYKPMK